MALFVISHWSVKDDFTFRSILRWEDLHSDSKRPKGRRWRQQPGGGGELDQGWVAWLSLMLIRAWPHFYAKSLACHSMFTWNICSLRCRIHIQILKLRLQRRLYMNIKTSKFFFFGNRKRKPRKWCASTAFSALLCTFLRISLQDSLTPYDCFSTHKCIY